jgi:uncharacterized Zn-binding protein involved in type VI secretion
MANVVLLGDVSLGHGCFPPTPLTATPVTKTKINGKLPAVVSPQCFYLPHVCGNTTHPSITRVFASGSPKTFIEGYPVARTIDSIVCGDKPSEVNTMFNVV